MVDFQTLGTGDRQQDCSEMVFEDHASSTIYQRMLQKSGFYVALRTVGGPPATISQRPE